ncbi:RNA-directed DNA polymerase [Chryseobacterium koreense]|uniref:Reverse transcriptase n=1 Tax=Chryseobacterium koreense CCUG 49689 TaxID=1304281 RepID=A0A0J7IVK9_9FLAO|nr:RNA-directed DNA polymerase [Chryseobacterium koreense]KMQ70333.1 reverse transcriptase [Chryseobacterium koreense CCUG 49689]MBB5334883.1 retron-type reverse transcriptase [Chryseobacterium koreense]
MKRLNNLFEKIISIENLTLADLKAQKGKRETYGVIQHNKNSENNILKLHDMLISKTYKTSQYDVFKVFEPKERDVYRLPYFPDRICHHAVMNVLEPIFVAVFTADSYSCIKGRGIHKASFALRKALENVDQTTYCLKLDIKKFYPNIDHIILKSLLRKKFKDPDLLWLLDEIIDSAPGLPIGNYLSQYLANFYLTYFDHWIKEQFRIKYYFRYADDIVILHSDKAYLWQVFNAINIYFQMFLKLEVKGNYQVFPVKKRGIDFVGYVHFHSHVLLRKSIKQRFARMLKRKPRKASIASYSGWTKHCDSKNLMKKLLTDVQF